MKQNCWEFRKCGRQPGGSREKESGPCPASIEERLHGVHGGVNGGRACWVVPATFCEERDAVTDDQDLAICTECEFYNLVKGEEKHLFIFSGTLLTDMIDDAQFHAPADHPSR